jgi:hypothetical protein
MLEKFDLSVAGPISKPLTYQFTPIQLRYPQLSVESSQSVFLSPSIITIRHVLQVLNPPVQDASPTLEFHLVSHMLQLFWARVSGMTVISGGWGWLDFLSSERATFTLWLSRDPILLTVRRGRVATHTIITYAEMHPSLCGRPIDKRWQRA